MTTLQDRIRGSLIGGAVGDALGYPIEFLDYDDIQKKYGEKGINRYDLSPYWIDKTKHTGEALISDDTQMTLFTANGLVNATRRSIPFIDGITRAYLEWLFTQTGRPTTHAHECWITEIPALHARRAPGNTCITSLEGISRHYEPMNNSKGCGGIMRVAPIPLYAVANSSMNIVEADKLAGDAAYITHHHPLGYIPAALLSHVMFRLLQDEKPTRETFATYVREGVAQMNNLYSESKTSLRRLNEIVNQAMELSSNRQDDYSNIRQIGDGWVGEETLAIALYCVNRYFDDFEQAIIASVNHNGDSDSTGAVTGNIAGLLAGYNAIPYYYKEKLELREVIDKVAEEMVVQKSNASV